MTPIHTYIKKLKNEILLKLKDIQKQLNYIRILYTNMI